MDFIETLQLRTGGRFPADSIEFTAIDVETTGLHPGHILEVAAVRVRGDGTVLGELSTLVNPGHGIDPGPTHVHRIGRDELDEAPPLHGVLAHLVEMLRGSVLVAHNLPFEKRFLVRELERLGVRMPALPSVCTLSTTRRALRLPNYRLATVAGAMGIADFPAHMALADARVCARVVSGLVTAHGLAFVAEPRLPKLPRLPGSGRLVPRVEPAADGRGGWMTGLVDRIPDFAVTGPDAALEDAYRDLLADALADQHLSADEGAALAQLAASAGMTPLDVRRVHSEFVKAMRRVAEGDGIVTVAEERDLRAVAGALGVGDVLADLRGAPVDAPRGRPTRVLVLGTGVEADDLRAEVLNAGIQLAKKLTPSVTHLTVGRDVPSSDPRFERAGELGVTVVDLANAREALGLVTARIPVHTPDPVPVRTAVSFAPPLPPQLGPPLPAQPGPRKPEPAPQLANNRSFAAGPARLLGSILGWALVGLGLFVMFVTVIVAFAGASVAPVLFTTVLGVGGLLCGWWLTERNRKPTLEAER